MGDQLINVYIDALPNQPKTAQSKDEFASLLRGRFEQQLAGAVDRYFNLPPLLVMNPSSEYLKLLLEARELFVDGHFYSCVAMCGIVGERLVKDVLRTSILIQEKGVTKRPTDEAFDQLERVEISGIIRFLKNVGLLRVDAAKAAEELGKLRNAYVHARGSEPEADAFHAIRELHTLVEGTVSVFLDYEIKEGKFVLKSGT